MQIMFQLFYSPWHAKLRYEPQQPYSLAILAYSVACKRPNVMICWSIGVSYRCLSIGLICNILD